jgi:hypothetical protein
LQHTTTIKIRLEKLQYLPGAARGIVILGPCLLECKSHVLTAPRDSRPVGKVVCVMSAEVVGVLSCWYRHLVEDVIGIESD